MTQSSLANVQPDIKEDSDLNSSDSVQTATVTREFSSAGLPKAYLARYGKSLIEADLERARIVATSDSPLVTIDVDNSKDAPITVRIFHRGSPPSLSTLLPRLENMGLEVTDYFGCALNRNTESNSTHVHEFVTRSRATEFEAQSAEIFTRVLSAVFCGSAECDDFNRLALAAALDVREISLIRAYAWYIQQCGLPFNNEYIANALVRHNEVCRTLVDHFLLRFSPDPQCDRKNIVENMAREIGVCINTVEHIDDERILRIFLELIEGTVRTNFFQRDADDKPKTYLSLKLDPANISDCPQPAPFRETIVFSPGFAGVHLRGAKVARGGIRYSDRTQDLRTEILGLYKAQQLKNVVIVPAGAKGGFVLRNNENNNRDEAITAYCSFIRGLLDVTDTIIDDEIVPMDRFAARWDGDDSYLVVAADKGTATFSDTANKIAREYDYWLGDAFASGGSVGYDHREMGITARGAWESVKRHFRELGKNIDEETFSVAGVGDMSGDVFGNGMLLSPNILLRAAFDHRHIFLDPNPDPAISFVERQRIACMSTSTWADYDTKHISAGGGIFSRTAKKVTLSAEAQRALGCEKSEVSPNELIKIILQTPADLLWFGGIGTYVRACEESDETVGDHANDKVRVEAQEVRATVIGEGANLGLTQRARISFALNGGRINSDAIDNAAGVNCSDHEVNIKILLNAAVRTGRLNETERDDLINTVRDDVARLVVRDNYAQTLSITLAEARSTMRVDRHMRLMSILERSGQLDRRFAGLPSDEQLLARHEHGFGLSRPEIAILLAYTKSSVAAALLSSDLPEDPTLLSELDSYFPNALINQCRGLLESHPMRKEIIVTRIVNSMINRVGSGFVNDMMDQTGCNDLAVVRAYAVARDVFDLRAFWQAVEALDNLVPAALQSEILLESGALVEAATKWLLQHEGHKFSISSTIELYLPQLRALEDLLPDLLPDDSREQLAKSCTKLQQLGVPPTLARRVAIFRLLIEGLEIVALARRFNLNMAQVGSTYYIVSRATQFDTLQAKLTTTHDADRYVEEANRAISDDLKIVQRRLVEVLLTNSQDLDPHAALSAWDRERDEPLASLCALADSINAQASINYPRLTVLTRQWRQLLEIK